MFEELIEGAELSLVELMSDTGTTTLDENYEPVFTPDNIITLHAPKVDLSASEKVARNQLQDNSTHKLIIPKNSVNTAINNKWTIKIDNVDYKITGVKKPVLDLDIMTVYIGV